jgi:hypothetical protein
MGGLWDLAPHLLSVLIPVLGAVDRISAESGPRDTTSLALHHASGATSIATVSLDAPEAAAVMDLVVWGERGRSWMPGWTAPPEQALSVAASELQVAATSGPIEHPCDVRLGQEIVGVLSDTAELLRSR